MSEYVLSIDQSTQGTKALLFDAEGLLICRADIPHKQIIDANGWVEHDPKEIYTGSFLFGENGEFADETGSLAYPQAVRDLIMREQEDTNE